MTPNAGRPTEGRTLLYVDKSVPTFDRDAGSAITRRYLEVLSELGFAVTFWPHDRAVREPYTTQLREMGIEIHVGKGSLRDCLADVTREIDVVCLARPEVAAAHVDTVRRLTRARVLYVAHDLQFLRYQRMHEVVGGMGPRWLAWRMERIELKVMRRCDATIVFSTAEKEILGDLYPRLKVEVWPWIEELAAAGPGFDERSGAAFVGSFTHSPNEDAALWFAEKVLPLVRRRAPEVDLAVIGAHPPPSVAALGSPRAKQGALAPVKVLGFVPDLAKHLNAARVFVAPLRYGAGINGKILTAMAHGLPVVTTTVGAEGIGIENEREVLIADTPEDFAEAVVSLHEAPGLWARLSREALDFVTRQASPEYARAVLKADLA